MTVLPDTEAHLHSFADEFNTLLATVEQVVQGKADQIALALVCLLSEGHLLIEDVPGTGKTVLAKTLAAAIDGTSSRVQFTPDLLPSDVTGGLVYRQHDGSFDLHRGPIFANVVLADEINRAAPKTQSALLEVMAERQVTIGTTTNPVPRPFLVIATQNPLDHAGTHRLPEAQLDRFLMRLSLGYPDPEAEMAVLAGVGMDPGDIEPVIGELALTEMIETAQRIHVAPTIRRYVVDLANASRRHPDLRLGLSTRGAQALLATARTLAASQGRGYVSVDDVLAMLPLVGGHRLILTSDAELTGHTVAMVLSELVSTVALPGAGDVDRS